MTIAASASTDSISPREGYAQWAPTYNEDANPVVAVQERILRAILPDAHGKTVVDLGCGTGRVLSLWREQGPARLIGIDVSPPMLQRATGIGDSLILADCCSIPLASGVADIVSCCLTLGYLPDFDSLVSEAARIVAPGGTVLISELHPESVVRFGWRRGFGHNCQSVNIDAHSFAIDEVISAFDARGLQADLLLEVPFGNPELPIFAAAGRAQQFEAFRDYPAIYLLQLHHRTPAASYRPIVLAGARVALSAVESATTDVTSAGPTISSIGVLSNEQTTSLDLSGYLLLPGLINAHDHLEFALFPRLGNGHYQNSREWAEEIYRPEESPIREHLRVPKWVRLWWGGIRNLLCGVTTVCHHNPYDNDVFDDEFPVRVVRDFAWAHSLSFDPETVTRFREAKSDIPFLIHAAEGIDDVSRNEIHRLSELGLLDSRTVIVHGTALDAEGFELLKNRGAGVVWCPSSNVFLFDKTLAPDQLASVSSKALGSDSPLTAIGDLLDEIRSAATLGAAPEMLFQLVTRQSNQVLQLKKDEGRIAPRGMADLVAVHDRGLSPADTLASMSYSDVELVIRGGKVHLVSDALKAALPEELSVGLELLKVDGVRRWVRAPIRDLLELSRNALGSEITMCGRSLTQ